MADTKYMEKQYYSATLGADTYQVYAALGGGVTANSGIYNVLDYGAVGDGSTEDTTAIQAAIDACIAGNGAIVYFPALNFITDQLTVGGSVSLIGQGTGEEPQYNFYGTRITMKTGMTADSLIKYTARAEDVRVEKMRIHTENAGTAGLISLYFAYGADKCTITDVSFPSWSNSGAYSRVGIQVDGEDPDTDGTLSYNTAIRDCYFYGFNYGIHINGKADVGKYVNMFQIENNTFDACEGANIRIDDGTDTTIRGNNLNGNSSMSNAYIEIDGPFTNVVSMANYFDNVGVGGNPSTTIKATNFTANATRCAIVSIGDNQPPDTFSVNAGGIWYHGKYDACQIATADDTTPSVLGVETLLLGDNTGATAITALDNARAGQEVTLLVTGSSNTPTIADSGNFNLSAAWAPGPGDTLKVVTSNGTNWYEVTRSNN